MPTKTKKPPVKPRGPASSKKAVVATKPALPTIDELVAREKQLQGLLRKTRQITRGRDPKGGGWNKKSVGEHLAEGTYRRDRHGPLAASVLDYPKPPTRVRASGKSQRRWVRSAADEMAFHEGCRFNEALALHAVEFFPRFLRHSKGQWAGEPFELLPWQRDDLIMPLFGWVRPDGTRRYRRAFVEIPKKNGKSTLASGIGLYMLSADGEAGAEVYSAASDKDQASIVHGEAIRMAEASAELSACLKINKSTRNIFYGATQSWYRALSSAPAGKEGLNIHAAMIDELHIWFGRDLWDSLHYGYRSRRQPLQFVITTAGDDDQSVCYEELERARQIVAGTVRDDAYFALIYELGKSEENDWQNEELWARVNPSLGKTFSIESLREDAAAAKGRPAAEAAFKRYTLNIWSRAANVWLSPDDWQRARREFDAEGLAGCQCYGGLDLSRTRDMTALALVFPCDEGGRRVYRQLVRFWIPQAGMIRYKDKIDFRPWIEAGWLEVLDDNYDPVEAAIVEAQQCFNLSGLAFDPMYARDFVQKLQAEHGIEPVEFGQTIMNFAGPTAEYERLLIHDALHHNDNPVLTWQAGHVQVKTDANANKRPVKPPNEDHRKIDGIVAGIMALKLAMAEPPESAYENGGVMYAGEIGGNGEEDERDLDEEEESDNEPLEDD